MGEVVDPSQDLCSPYHVSLSHNSSLNRVYSLITQQERQVFGDQSKAMIATSKGGYNNNATIYGMGGGYGRRSYGRGYTSKICSYCGKTGHIKPFGSTHIINTVNVSASDLETLWHFRLGHISNKCIDVIKNKFPFVKYNKSFVCDVCRFTKQKRLSFPISTSKSEKCFDLIHVDIWGPYLM